MTASNAAPSKIIPNSYQAPNFLVDDLMRYLSGNEHKCVDVVCRKTFGWQKRSDRISKTQLMELTGMGEDAIDQCMGELVKYRVVIRVSESVANKGVEWAMQLDDSLINLQGLIERDQQRREANYRKMAAAIAKRKGGVVEPPQVVVPPVRGVVEPPTQKPIKTKIQEEEEGGQSLKFEISNELQTELQDLGVFVSTWQHVEKQIAAGWTETDVLALIDWMSKTRRDKQRAAQGFVTRVREGTKAPSEYYEFTGRKLAGRWYPGKSAAEAVAPASTSEEPEPEYFYVQADETVTLLIERAWQSLLGQLAMEMPKATFSTWMQDTQPVHFENDTLQVATRSAYARDWLESRLQSTCERLLVGILNQSVDVVFVVAAETEVVE